MGAWDGEKSDGMGHRLEGGVMGSVEKREWRWGRQSSQSLQIGHESHAFGVWLTLTCMRYSFSRNLITLAPGKCDLPSTSQV